jgi:hypothetical protein
VKHRILLPKTIASSFHQFSNLPSELHIAGSRNLSAKRRHSSCELTAEATEQIKQRRLGNQRRRQQEDPLGWQKD